MSTNPDGLTVRGVSWSDVRTVQALAPVVSTLLTIASNPEQWVRVIIAEWVVGGILDAAAYVLGWAIYAFTTVRNVMLDVAGPIATPYTIVESAAVGGIETLYAGIQGSLEALGIAAPIAAAFTVALLVTILAVTAFAILYLIPGSDAAEGALEALR
ncbi:hypothetical protein [Halorarum salinum]|uniref:Uncharacterized protein n=1 Tax=Halorarum salinum TaxID=2743089 RepID=A0A7D5QBF6_9EURY|nr:hypothetical protein [Halobaculum salinum]QLG62199.1 hypothetical protein HUG12_10840 [Halobaculum salinum]